MTKKEAFAVIGFIQMLPRFESTYTDDGFRKVSDRQMEDYINLVNAMVDDEKGSN